jgi:hypothetical protein
LRRGRKPGTHHQTLRPGDGALASGRSGFLTTIELLLMSGKTILFVGLWYHDYTQSMIDEMVAQGHTVEYVDIQPRSLAFKVFKTLAPALYQRYLAAHHRRAILATRGRRFDTVLFLQAHQMSLENMRLLKELQPMAEFLLYNWDALSNHDYLPQAPFFDQVYTFDKVDAERHGFQYLPLFCMRFIQQLRRGRAPSRTVYTIGNIVNIQRYQAIERFRAYCQAHRIELTTYLVCSPVVYARMLLRGIVPRGVYLRSIKRKQFSAMVEEAAAVFDFANHAQTGYTMRTIENLCAGKKIITNNRLITADSFYSADRVLCFEGFDFGAVSAFLDVPLQRAEERFTAFHIQSFIRTLLGGRSAAVQAAPLADVVA